MAWERNEERESILEKMKNFITKKTIYTQDIFGPKRPSCPFINSIITISLQAHLLSTVSLHFTQSTHR